MITQYPRTLCLLFTLLILLWGSPHNAQQDETATDYLDQQVALTISADETLQQTVAVGANQRLTVSLSDESDLVWRIIAPDDNTLIDTSDTDIALNLPRNIITETTGDYTIEITSSADETLERDLFIQSTPVYDLAYDMPFDLSEAGTPTFSLRFTVPADETAVIDMENDDSLFFYVERMRPSGVFGIVFFPLGGNSQAFPIEPESTATDYVLTIERSTRDDEPQVRTGTVSLSTAETLTDALQIGDTVHAIADNTQTFYTVDLNADDTIHAMVVSEAGMHIDIEAPDGESAVHSGHASVPYNLLTASATAEESGIYTIHIYEMPNGIIFDEAFTLVVNEGIGRYRVLGGGSEETLPITAGETMYAQGYVVPDMRYQLSITRDTPATEALPITLYTPTETIVPDATFEDGTFTYEYTSDYEGAFAIALKGTERSMDEMITLSFRPLEQEDD